jgi:hypothetical protein
LKVEAVDVMVRFWTLLGFKVVIDDRELVLVLSGYKILVDCI